METLVRRKIRFIAIKEAIEFDGKQDLRTKVMIALFGLFAEVERDLLDGKEQDIRALLGKDVSKASIAKILDVSRSTLYHFMVLIYLTRNYAVSVQVRHTGTMS